MLGIYDFFEPNQMREGFDNFFYELFPKAIENILKGFDLDPSQDE